MSLITDLQRELQEASAAVARAERVAVQYPDRPSVLATLETIESRRRGLEEQFIAAALDTGLDICSYRVEFESRRRATIGGIMAALGIFQKIFTSVYDALLNGTKKRARVSDEIEAQTAFGFGYTFPGSVGFVMNVPSERSLLDETRFDEAMRKTLELLALKQPQDVQYFAETVGLPAVRLAHQWAIENSKAGFGADIVWKHDMGASYGLRVQAEEVLALAGAIGSAIAKEQITLVGELLNVNYSERTFEMKVRDQLISGSFLKAISEEKPAQVPKTYQAVLEISTKVVLVDGQERVNYFLVSLDEPPGYLLSERSPS